MKIYALYYKDMFVVGFPNREDCITYGKKHYEGMEWECNIVEKYIHNSPLTTIPPYTTLTPSQTIPCKVSDVAYPFTIDYSQPPKANGNVGEIFDSSPFAPYDNGPFTPRTK